MSRPAACFIVGTDTDVGKTMVTAGLLRALSESLGSVQAIKPVQTGGIIDEAVYARACPGARVKTLRHYQLAASPHLAAAAEGRRLDLDRLAEEIIRELARAEFTLIEGAGGLCTPLSPTETFLDLMGRLPFPVILVVRNALGAINHSLLSVAALRGFGLKAAGLIINQTVPPAVDQQLILSDNLDIIPGLSRVPLLAALPNLNFTDMVSDPEAVWAELAVHLKPAVGYLLNIQREA